MGLLDSLLDDPGSRTALGLLAAAGPSAVPQSFGQRLMGGLLQADEIGQQRERAQAMKQMQALQMQQQQMALAQAQRHAEQQKQQDAFRQSIESPQAMAIRQATANGGITQANASAMPQADPNAQLLHGAMRAGLVDPIQYITSQRKDNTPMKLGAGEALIDPKTFKPIYTNPKEDATDPFVRLLKQSGIDPTSPQGQALLRQRLQKESSHQPGTQVSVNTGQKGFDNTLKLRGDFRAEPIYKAHQEMESAYSQIQQALKQSNPVGDLAGATKIMKLLDPGSVVRESELGMAVSATGLEDKIRNYAGNIISGNKLTPKQRQEFQALADDLVNESRGLYNTKRGEYQGIAERNGLSTADVLGAEASRAAQPKKQVVRTGTHNGRKVVQYADGTTDYAD